MANIAPGLGGTFKTSTAEGRAIEALMFCQLAEKDLANNPNGDDNISGTINLESLFFEGTYRLPVDQVIGTDGTLILTATSYLVGLTINPGSDNPTFKSTTPERYLLEVLMYLQGFERNALKNPQGLNAISGSYNSDLALYQGGFQIPIAIGMGSNGSIEINASPYLLT